MLDKVELPQNLTNNIDSEKIEFGKGTILDAKIKQAQTITKINTDNDADFTQKRRKVYYGYKGHNAIDEDSEVIKIVEFTKASVHDSSAFNQLVDYSEKAVFAEKGYTNKTRGKKLEAISIFDGILANDYRNSP